MTLHSGMYNEQHCFFSSFRIFYFLIIRNRGSRNANYSRLRLNRQVPHRGCGLGKDESVGQSFCNTVYVIMEILR